MDENSKTDEKRSTVYVLESIDDSPLPTPPERPAIGDIPGDELPPGTPFGAATAEDFGEVVNQIRHGMTKVLGSLLSAVQSLDVSAKLQGIGPERIVDVVFNDRAAKFHLPFAGDDHFQTEMMRFRRIADHELMVSLIRKISTQSVILDIGGYLGEHSVIYSKLLKPKHIHIFEPQLTMAPVIERTLALNGITNATLHQRVVADGTAMMALGRQRHFRLDETSFVAREDGEYLSLAIDDLDLDQVDYVKLDFDGTKMLALRGMQRTLERFHPVICTEARGRDIGEQAEFLGALGYRSEPLPQGHFLFIRRR